MIPEWLYGKSIAVWDIETDLIPTTEIYCIGVGILTISDTGFPSYTQSKTYTQYWTPYSNGSLMQAITLINSCDYHSGHNIISFDVMQIRQHMSIDINAIPLDTLIISKLMFSKEELFIIDSSLGIKLPDKPYALKAFGNRLGDFKIEFEDFSGLTEQMVIYCNQDVDLTARLLLHLLGQHNFPSLRTITLEHKAASIIAEQTLYGFYVDIDKLHALNTSLLNTKLTLHEELSEIFKPKWLKDGKVKKYKGHSKSRKFVSDNHYIQLLGTRK